MKKKSNSPLPKLKAKAFGVFAAWIKRKEKGTCFTCGKKVTGIHAHAGHFIHGALDFCEYNIHCQCETCNIWERGNPAKYLNLMAHEYGWDLVNNLKAEARMIYKPTREELELIIEHYKEKA
jgi:hypothetical protein